MKLFTYCRFSLKRSVAVIVAFALGDDVVVALENSRQIAFLKYASPNQGGKFWFCPWGMENWSFSTHASTYFHYHGIQLRRCESIGTSCAVLVISWVYATDLELPLSDLGT